MKVGRIAAQGLGLVLWAALSSSLAASEIVGVDVEPPGRHTIGDRVVVRLRLLTPDGVRPEPAVPSTAPERVAWSVPTTTRRGKTADGQRRWDVRYPLQVFEVGDVRLQPLEVAVGREVLRTDTLRMAVTSVRGTSDAALLRDVRPPLPWPASRMLWVALVGAVLAAASLVWALRRRRPSSPARAATPAAFGPDEWLAQELARLESSAVGDQESLRRFVARVADAVREYLSQKGDIPAPLRTSAGTLRAARDLLPTPTLDTMREFLMAADFVKFARHAPPGDVAQAYLAHARRLCAEVAGVLGGGDAANRETPNATRRGQQ
jgi:hypothetical protein